LKQSDFFSQQDKTTASFERKIMELEESLTMETHKCAEVVRARVEPLKERIDKLKQQLEVKSVEESEARSKVRELTG